MDLEELTKTQIILLVLLVSFVTSIATGIVTVSLLEQAPSAVTQTVNQVIERTVQTVVPDTGTQIITKETTVVVKEDDLVTKSIADSFDKIGRVHETAATSSPVVALGSLLGSGTLVTDSVVGSGMHAVDLGGDTFFYLVSESYPDIGVVTMAATGTAPTGAFKTVSMDSVRLGQTVIGLYGRSERRVAIATVAGNSQIATVGTGEKKVPVRSLDTTIAVTLSPGTPLVNAFGDLAGISTGVSRVEDGGSFVAMSDILALITASQVKGEATSTPSQ